MQDGMTDHRAIGRTRDRVILVTKILAIRWNLASTDAQNICRRQLLCHALAYLTRVTSPGPVTAFGAAGFLGEGMPLNPLIGVGFRGPRCP